MKVFLYLIIASISFLSASAQEYGWVDISGNLPDSAGSNLVMRDLFFLNDLEGWLCNQTNEMIFHTTDGGESWEIQYVAYPLYAIHMLDSLTGYAGGNSGRVYKTTNGGNDWVVHGAIGDNILDIYFPHDSDTGYCCGLGGRVYQITPSGVKKLDIDIISNLSGISFPTSTTEGWVIGGYYIFHYINDEWTNADQSHLTSFAFSSIFFVPGTTQGWVVGSQGSILHTTDGKNWVKQISITEDGLYDVVFTDTLSGWVVGINGIILHTVNGGDSWESQVSGISSGFTSVFATPNAVYTCGENSTILKYTKSSSAVEEDRVPELGIYPNPAIDIISISGEIKPNSQYEISDINGNISLNGNLPESQSIDISSLQLGAYFIKIISGDEVFTEKFIVEK